ncbi:MAG: class I SAM-dependent methyltransferase [Terriglobia bacterium]|jgi:methionine biosynthesis protein MetW
MEAAYTVEWITENDRSRSATSLMMDDLARALEPIRNRKFSRLLDIGCGFGGLTFSVGNTLGIDEIHGIDIDGLALREAADKGVLTHQLDIGRGALPFENRYFDLVISFGMLDYLPFFDDALREIFRIVKVGGYALISLPNLASWHNRLMLLEGYQPRDVEVSREIVVGLHPWYHDNQVLTGHIHSITTRGFIELMAHHGFEKVTVIGARPPVSKRSFLARLADAFFSREATLARRFFYLGVKSTDTVERKSQPTTVPCARDRYSA